LCFQSIILGRLLLLAVLLLRLYGDGVCMLLVGMCSVSLFVFMKVILEIVFGCILVLVYVCLFLAIIMLDSKRPPRAPS
jgi:hypothetical protein